MHRGTRRAAWALLAAGALGVAGPAVAQTLGSPASEPSPGRMIQAGAPGQPLLTEGQSRREEAKVELAWLADPATFPYHLAARVDGPTLEVRGYVPNEAVRERALQVVRENTILSIADGMKVHAALATRSVGAPAEEVQQAAADVLADAFPQQAPQFQITVKPNGQVTVIGTIGSVEDQLAVSRRLRQVRGCTSVVNRLNAAVVYAQPAAMPVVSAPPVPAPTAVAKPMVAPAPAADSTRAQPGPLPAQASATPAAPSATASTSPYPGGLTILTGPATPSPTVQTAAAPARLPAALPGAARPLTPPKPAPPSGIVPASYTPSAPRPSPTDASYVTTGVVLFDDDPAPRPAPKAAAPGGLKQRIEQICGGGAREVEVVQQSPSNVQVHFKVRNSEEGKRLSARIMEMPELAPPCQVHLQMELDQ